jgi:FkbM family methyltransferase
LRKHLQINRCSNVIVENAALGQTESKAKLYVYQEDELSGFNSLKEPDIKGVKDCLPVAVESLDFYLNRSGIDYSGIDFLKIDVEGGEKDILLGAKNLLTAKKRPLILCEVEDKRTKPWGYMSIEIIEILKSYGFYCFSIERGGKLKIHSDQIEVNGNLLFVPPERYQSVDHLLNSK